MTMPYWATSLNAFIFGVFFRRATHFNALMVTPEASW
jgi:hypothetical protein